MKAYVVVRGDNAAAILRAALARDLLAETEIVAEGPQSTLVSVARTLVVARRKPVALLVDTKTVDEPSIQEKRQTTEELMRWVAAGVPTKVILLVPQLEAVFFQAEGLLPRVFGGPLSGEVRILGRFSPGEALDRLFAQPGGPKNMEELLASLDEEGREALRATPPLRELIAFLQDAVRSQEKHIVA
jgi:hypothetical protein